MKHKISLLAVITLSLTMLCACGEKSNNGTKVSENTSADTSTSTTVTEVVSEYGTSITKTVVSKEEMYKKYESDYDIDVAFQNISKYVVMSGDSKLSSEKINELYGIDYYKDVEADVRIVSNKDDYHEIAILKLNNTNQYTMLLSEVSKRMKALETSNPNVSQDEDHFRVEFNNGVMIVVIGNDAKAIMDVLTMPLKTK